MTTKAIVDEFCAQINEDQVYNMKELKDILGEIYKVKTGKPTKKSTKKAKDENAMSDSDDEKVKPKKAKKTVTDKNDKPVKAKRAPTAYNNYMSVKIKELKLAKPTENAKALMAEAAGMWKVLTPDEKEVYKTKTTEVDETKEE